MSLRNEQLLIFDGACGSNIQEMKLSPAAWGAYEGCNEYLNLSAPDAIVSLHASFIEAGAHVLETNTFGASDIVLAEYNLQDKVEAINHAAVENARKAIAGRSGRYIAGSIGPTTKMPSLGHISFEGLANAYARQIRALLEAGVDLLVFETCQDLLQVKIALVTCREVFDQVGRDVPVMVSLTIESTGTMLAGSDIASACAAIEPFGVFSLGLNCATGPEKMKSHVRYLGKTWPARVSCIPNAGIPHIVDGKTVYPLSPAEYAAALKAFVVEDGVSIVGGCCGTTPDHIRELVKTLDGIKPADRNPQWKPSISSVYQAVEIAQDIAPLLIGERANANGSKAFREALLADDYQAALKIGIEQQGSGAHAADLCTAYAGRDEKADMSEMIRLFAESVRLPVVIDSTIPDVVEAALRIHPGRCVINSINLEDGGKNLEKLCKLAKKYGAACVALTINEKGMALTTADKVATAQAIYDLAVGKYGLRAGDLLFDALTFTIGAGDETLRTAGEETIEGIRGIKMALPGVFTLLGVSNISFGLMVKARKILNSVFLHEAVEAGLDAAIIDAGKVMSLAQIPAEEREICLDLIYNRQKPDTDKTPLTLFIEHFTAKKADDGDKKEEDEHKPAEQQLADKIVAGDKEALDDLLSILLQRRNATAIINEILVPAMRHVGDLFGRGEMLLPFVLQSAEVMKRSVNFLEPYMTKAENESSTKVLLATVQGDVHDIGKNLVDIILSNNGYKVYNIGIKVPAETIIEKAREYNVDVIGLSGLLVKSAIVMQENMPQFAAAGLTQPILLGGAALTPKFVAKSCVPGYPQPVVYCVDAFAGLKALRDFEAGQLKPTVWTESPAGSAMKPGPKEAAVIRDNPVPIPPFIGHRHVTGIDANRIFPYINEQALFRGRWGYRRAKMTAEEYDKLIETKVRPMYEDLKRRVVAEDLVQAKAAYGYFRCHSDGDTLVVEHEGREHCFPFPRQAADPHLCITSYFKSRDEGGDIVGFFVVTIGERISQLTKQLFESDQYHDYLIMHAFSVEVTDALAEYWHEVMRDELGIGGKKPTGIAGYVVQEYQGSRYGFGYPACPDMDAHKPVFEMLKPEDIGVTLTENMEMVPEQSTSAIVSHHPQAKYFAV
jgi:5-methyltetrahydrofolate--homocysteine methyltransferase